MSLRFEEIKSSFAARATGIDLRQALSQHEVEKIHHGMSSYAVLVWPNQALSQDQHVKFATQLGRLDIGLKRVFKRNERLLHEELIDISNLDTSGQIAPRNHPKNFSNYANQLWHCDSSFQNPRASYSMLNAVVLTTWGGQTEFADMRAAWDELDPRLQKQIIGLKAEHYALHSRDLLGDGNYTQAQREEFPPVSWPLVQMHTESKRKHLFLGAHIRGIDGWYVPEARTLINELTEHATQAKFVYSHNWQIGDLVMWDNRCTLHRGRRFDIQERRELRRTTILDEVAQTMDFEAQSPNILSKI